MGRIWGGMAKLDTSLSLAEWMWRIFSVFCIGGGSYIAAILAKADPYLQQLGPIYWYLASLLSGLFIAFLFYLIKVSILRQAQADYHRSLSAPKSQINPLAKSFSDLIIPIDDLNLPSELLHERKHFQRCKFVGPGALVIAGGGRFIGNHFIDVGDIIAVPDKTKVTGIIVLKDCTIEDCEFVRVSILADQGIAGAVAAAGFPVKGLKH